MIISDGGLQKTCCFSLGSICMVSMAKGERQPKRLATICLAESEHISSTLTCKRESGTSCPSMTHLWAEALNETSAKMLMSSSFFKLTVGFLTILLCKDMLRSEIRLSAIRNRHKVKVACRTSHEFQQSFSTSPHSW